MSNGKKPPAYVLMDFFAGDNLSCALCQEQEYGKLLRLQPDWVAALAQFTIDGIECEGAETDCARLDIWRALTAPPRR